MARKMVVHTCSLIAYVGSRRWCSGSFCAREPSLRSQKSCRQVKARTSSPRPQFRVTSLAAALLALAENVSIRKLASGRTVQAEPRVCGARLCTVGAAARWDWRRLSRFGTKKFGKRENLETATGTFSNDTRQYHRGLKRGYYKSRARHCAGRPLGIYTLGNF